MPAPVRERSIIADAPLLARDSRVVPLALAATAAIIGLVAVWHYWSTGLTLSHYDAKAHLVVARRVIDSLTPNWKQFGGVWLPLPHVVNVLPVQWDWAYRTGATAIAVSLFSFATLIYASARLILKATRSPLAAAAGVSVAALNPDLLYLQSTPMTEPLLLALTFLSILRLTEWVQEDGREGTVGTGLVLSAAFLTRYEAWPMTAAALTLCVVALVRRGHSPADAVRLVSRLAIYPAIAAILFLLQSRFSTGQWFVTGGFYVADNLDKGRPFKTIGSIWWATHRLNGYPVLLVAVAGAAAITIRALWRRADAHMLVALALLASAALPWYAFFSGHPFRIRYMVPLIPALGVFAGIAVGSTRRLQYALAPALVALVLAANAPLNPQAPMVLEAQFDRPNSAARRAVTAYLQQHRQAGLVFVSFGSLSHYVQELASAGFQIRDFLHEGNDEFWGAALQRPRLYADWMLIEELAEGGDQLAARARTDPGFLEGFERVAEGGGVALYRRTD